MWLQNILQIVETERQTANKTTLHQCSSIMSLLVSLHVHTLYFSSYIKLNAGRGQRDKQQTRLPYISVPIECGIMSLLVSLTYTVFFFKHKIKCRPGRGHKNTCSEWLSQMC